MLTSFVETGPTLLSARVGTNYSPFNSECYVLDSELAHSIRLTISLEPPEGGGTEYWDGEELSERPELCNIPTKIQKKDREPEKKSSMA